MLDQYIAGCEAVVHFVGQMTGSAPAPVSVEGLFQRHPGFETRLAQLGVASETVHAISYTQWEAWLALLHGKDLVIVTLAPSVAPDAKSKPTQDSQAAQAAHLARLKAIDYFPKAFTGEDNLVALIYASAVLKALVKAAAAPQGQPRNLPYLSLGELFVGRARELGELRAALVGATGKAALAGRALHGLGGVGKTRLAIEYAWLHQAAYTALLFVRADDPEKLNANLAALAGAEGLDLPEKIEPHDDAKTAAVVRWLDAHPTWLMILDNVDDENAVAAVGKLLPRLKGGHFIVTGRAVNFPAAVRKLELGVLDEEFSTKFLLERTTVDRDAADDDALRAKEIAHELGGLALGLEQAGAYIATERIGFADYLKLWRESRETVVEWFDKTLTSYDHDTGLAATWATSVARLTAESCRLLDRLAMLAPDPVPDFLLEVAVPGEAADYDAKKARAGLFAYSLIARTSGEDGIKGFAMHRLVQDFARRAMTPERGGEALHGALSWVNAAFKGDPVDVQSWPTLDPLAPHALVVALRADAAGLTAPTGELLNQLALLAGAKARYAEAELLSRRALAIYENDFGSNHHAVATLLNNLGLALHEKNQLDEAEPLFRRALKIDEASLGPQHANVARDLGNLARALQADRRFREAEPLYRRALKIDEARLEPNDPKLATRLNNLATLLRVTERNDEAEPLFRRALAIDEANFGPDHPKVAIRLGNLGHLLQGTKRTAEAEPLFRRALAISDKRYGPDHPDVATGANNLGVWLHGEKRFREAEPLFRCALAIREQHLGKDHPRTVTVRNNLLALPAAGR
jgi:tetratricopeptide (TPR) repeat protein